MGEQTAGARPSQRARFVLLACLALGAALRLAKLPGTSLSYDGLQSVTHAVRGFPVNALSAMLHDPHPPLYYVLLGGWMTLGTSDAVVLLLSVLTSLAAVASVWWVARAHYGEHVAGWAALVCALHPLALYWSHFARMYALVMLLAVWAWHANLVLLARDTWRWRDSLAVVGAQLALVYTHVAGPFFVAFTALHALWQHRSRERLPRWIVCQAATVAAALPALVLATRIRPGHMVVPDFFELTRTLSLFSNGSFDAGTFWMSAGALGFVAVAAALLAQRETRAFAVCFLVLPFAAAAVVSHTAKPIWYGPRLFAFVLPFFALGLARLLAGGGLATRIAGFVALALVARGAATYTLTYDKQERFVEAARILAAEVQPGDLVLVPTLRDKWALNWYLEGPAWSRGAWRHSGAEAVRQVLDGDRRAGFAVQLASYGLAPGPEWPPILPAPEHDDDALAAARRVWVLARNLQHRDALLARYDVPGAGSPRPAPGLELSLHPRP